jgi:hypothetical protein
LSNRVNGNTAIVGSVCVTRFLRIPTETLFGEFRRISKNKASALSVNAVEYAYHLGLLTQWERRFFHDTLRIGKRRLTHRQLVKRMQINTLILRRLSARGGPCPC